LLEAKIKRNNMEQRKLRPRLTAEEYEWLLSKR